MEQIYSAQICCLAFRLNPAAFESDLRPWKPYVTLGFSRRFTASWYSKNALTSSGLHLAREKPESGWEETLTPANEKRKSPVKAYLNFLNWFPPITVTLFPKAINIIIDADTGNKWCDNPFYIGGSLRATDLRCLSRESRKEEESHWNGAVTLRQDTAYCSCSIIWAPSHSFHRFLSFNSTLPLRLRLSKK